MNRRISAVTLVFLIILAGIFPVKAATNEGYGEDQTSLGQFVDSFENSNNVSVTVNVIRNATLEAMVLNGTSEIPLLQNYTEYVEVDPGNDIVRYLRNITWVDVVRGTESYVYLDNGAGNIDDFQYNFTLILTDTTDGATQNLITFVSHSNGIGSFADTIADDWLGMVVLSTNINDKFEFRILQYTGGVRDFSAIGAERDIGTFYLTFNRTGTVVTFRAYSNPIRNATYLLETLTDGGNGANTNYRYQYGIQSWDSGFLPNARSSGSLIDVWNMTVVGGYATEGYFTTVDYLSDPLANGSALTVLVNTNIPANTDIQLQISNDNATWRDHEGVIGDSEDLLGGNEAIDLRDLNYSGNIYFRGNLSTTDPAVTPRFNQIRLITTIGTGGITVNQTINLLNGTWVRYNLSAIEIVVGVHDGGTLASTYFIDADVWMCSEVAGIPGYQINFNATGIDTEAISLYAEIWMFYDGANNHVINVDFWNFTSLAWVTLGQIPDMVGYEWQNHTIWGLHDPVHFLNSSGAIVGRLRHVSNGNINDDIWIDSFQILAFVPTGLARVADEVFQFFWIVLAIALMLIAILISKMWFEEGDP